MKRISRKLPSLEQAVANLQESLLILESTGLNVYSQMFAPPARPTTSSGDSSMVKPRHVGFIRAIVFCPNCKGSIRKLVHIHDRSSSRRVTMPCGHCQTSLEIFLCLKVALSLPAVEPCPPEDRTE
jgi:hypothetical protein